MSDYRLKGIPKIIFGGNGSSDETSLKSQLAALQSEINQLRDALRELRAVLTEARIEYDATIKSRNEL